MPTLLSKKRIVATISTVDPTSTVYNSTMLVMAGLLAIALLANLLICLVDPAHYGREDGSSNRQTSVMPPLMICSATGSGGVR